MLNDRPCGTCRHLQTAPDGDHPLLANIQEEHTVVRGGERFFVCPDCEKLYAVKKKTGEKAGGAEERFDVISAAFANRHYHWTYENAEGAQERTKSTMTEQEARKRFTNPQKVVSNKPRQPYSPFARDTD